MTSVLGKRSRCSGTAEYSTRSKRMSRTIQVHNDQPSAPLLDVVPLSVTKMAAAELALFTISTPSPIRSTARPAKHGKPESLSRPFENIAAHFVISKGPVNMLEKNTENITPPITPRHRDSAPIKAPVTPQNRVRVPGSLLTPRTPSSPLSNSKPSPYAQARQLFSAGAGEGLLVGRGNERSQLDDFISQALSCKTGGCIYVSGPPGTGKSAFIADVLRQGDYASQATLASINCMSVKNASELLTIISTELGLDILVNKKMDMNALKRHLTIRSDDAQPIVLVLDEIDRLVELDLKLLYSLFEWSMQGDSNLTLVGIANALDLTDRLLPKLKSRNIKPSLLPFMPYTAPQINDIITSKLKSLTLDSPDASFVPLLQPAAILLCSKKVASQTGDLRKAFDIIRRALTLAENEARLSTAQSSPAKSPLSENINLSSPPMQTKLTALAHLTPATAPRATIAHVAKVTSQIFSNGMSSRLSQLNIQQRAVLCALASFEKRARSSLAATLASMTAFIPPTPSKTGRGSHKVDSPTTKQLYDSYAELCKRENLLHPLSSVEFRDVLSGLETLSLVEFIDGSGKGTLGLMTPTRTPSRKGRGKKAADFGQMGLGSVVGEERRVSSVVGFEELRGSLTGPGSDLLKELLED